MKKLTPNPGMSKEDVSYVYGSDRELERIQRAARNRDSVSSTGKKTREVFVKTPRERIADDSSSALIPRPGNTAREGMLLAGTKTPPARIRDRLPMDHGYKKIEHGIHAPTKSGFEVARAANESLKEFEAQERDRDQRDRDIWAKIPNY